jgi:hypothetical protein
LVLKNPRGTIDGHPKEVKGVRNNSGGVYGSWPER